MHVISEIQNSHQKNQNKGTLILIGLILIGVITIISIDETSITRLILTNGLHHIYQKLSSGRFIEQTIHGSGNHTTLKNPNETRIVVGSTSTRSTQLKAWDLIFFQHLRKNGGSMICKVFYDLKLTSATLLEHNCQLPDPSHDIKMNSFKQMKAMSIEEYTKEISRWKHYVNNTLKVKFAANEGQGFPIIPCINLKNNDTNVNNNVNVKQTFDFA